MQNSERDPTDYTEEWAAQRPWQWALVIVGILLVVGIDGRIISPVLGILLSIVLLLVTCFTRIGRCPACGGYPGRGIWRGPIFCQNCGVRLRDD